MKTLIGLQDCLNPGRVKDFEYYGDVVLKTLIGQAALKTLRVHPWNSNRNKREGIETSKQKKE